MTAALEGSEWSAARPGRTSAPRKTRYPLYRWLGGTQGQSGRAENLVHTGIRFRRVQPVVSRYTDWATRPTLRIYIHLPNESSKVVSFTHRPALPSRWHPNYSFMSEAESKPEPYATRRINSMEHPINPIENRTHDIPASSAAPHPTGPQRNPIVRYIDVNTASQP